MINGTQDRRPSRLVAIAAAILAACLPLGAGLAHTTNAAGYQVIHPWTEPAAQGQATKAYPTLVSQSEGDMVLAGVSTDAAQRVDIIVDGAPAKQLVLPAGKTVGSDSFHLRLVGLTRGLEDGGHFTATLRFADGRTKEITMVVGETTMAPGS